MKTKWVLNVEISLDDGRTLRLSLAELKWVEESIKELQKSLEQRLSCGEYEIKE